MFFQVASNSHHQLNSESLRWYPTFDTKCQIVPILYLSTSSVQNARNQKQSCILRWKHTNKLACCHLHLQKRESRLIFDPSTFFGSESSFQGLIYDFICRKNHESFYWSSDIPQEFTAISSSGCMLILCRGSYVNPLSNSCSNFQHNKQKSIDGTFEGFERNP